VTTDLGEYGDGEEPAYAPTEQPRRRPRLTRRHLVAIPLVLLLVEAAFLGERLHAQRGLDADPVRVASAFFTAVQTDHAGAAAALTRLPASVDARFTPADLRAQGGIDRPMVTRSTRNGDRATVSVAYTVAGFLVHSDVVLARTYDGFLHTPTWRIVGGLPVVHVRAAPFETTSSVDGRRVALHRGSADVTVFPGIVQVSLAAFPPAASTTNTVSATGEGTVVRFPAILDTETELLLEETISAAIRQDRGAAFPYYLGSDPTVTLGDKAKTLAFRGQLQRALLTPDPNSGLARAVSGPSLSGTATYANSRFTITELHIG
jgi:hypothetical protein